MLFALVLVTASLFVARRRRDTEHPALTQALTAPVASTLLLLSVLAQAAYPRALFGIHDLLGLLSLLPLYRLLPVLVRNGGLRAPLSVMLLVLAAYRALVLLHLDSPWSEAGLFVVGSSLAFTTRWLIRAGRRAHPLGDDREAPLAKLNFIYLQVSVIGLAVGLAFGALGYAEMLRFLVDGFMSTSYWLLLSVAFTRVLSAFIEAILGALRSRRLPSVSSHYGLIRSRALWCARAIGMALWVSSALLSFGLMGPLLAVFHSVLGSSAQVGSWTVSVGGIASFALTMYLALKLARFASFELDQGHLAHISRRGGHPPQCRSDFEPGHQLDSVRQHAPRRDPGGSGLRKRPGKSCAA